MTPAERQASTLATLITKARDNELTSSEIVDCLHGIGKLNHPDGSSAHVRISANGFSSLCLSMWDREPKYTGRCIEDALIAAYDDLQRIIAEEGGAA